MLKKVEEERKAKLGNASKLSRAVAGGRQSINERASEEYQSYADGRLPYLQKSSSRTYSPGHLQPPESRPDVMAERGEWKESPVRFDRDSVLSNGADGFLPFAGSKQDSNRDGQAFFIDMLDGN